MPHLTHVRGLYPVTVRQGALTYQIRTDGCQMNMHDSERLAGLLDQAWLCLPPRARPRTSWCSTPARSGRTRPLRLYGNLGHLLPQKRNGMQIAVGGCLAQMERTRITQRAPWVDVVYGTHNMGSLPALLEKTGQGAERGAGRVREHLTLRGSSTSAPDTHFTRTRPQSSRKTNSAEPSRVRGKSPKSCWRNSRPCLCWLPTSAKIDRTATLPGNFRRAASRSRPCIAGRVHQPHQLVVGEAEIDEKFGIVDFKVERLRLHCRLERQREMQRKHGVLRCSRASSRSGL